METLQELAHITKDKSLRKKFCVLLMHLPFVVPYDFENQESVFEYFDMLKLATVTVDAINNKTLSDHWSQVCKI